MDTNKAIKITAALAGIAAIGALVKYLLQPIEKEEPNPPPRAGSQRSPPPQKPQPKVEEIKEEPAKRTEKISLEEYLGFIKEINDVTLKKFTLLKSVFIKNRRENLDSPEKYEEIVRKFRINEKKVMESTYKEFLEKNNIDHNAYEDARQEYLNEYAVATEKENLKNALNLGQPIESLDVEKLKEIMETEIKLLSDAENSDDEVKNLETICRIEDKLYEKFGYNIEDIRATSAKYQSQVKGFTRQILRNYQKFKL